MIDVETFLTTVYVLVDDIVHDRAAQRRPTGPAAALSESEVITLALFAQWARFESERAFYRYAEQRLRPLFPLLPARSQFTRAMRRLGGRLGVLGGAVAQRIEGLHAARRGIACPYELLDGMGVPTRNCQRRAVGWLPQIAPIGRCNRVGWYEGVHLLTAATPTGTLTGFGCAPANTKDQPLAETFLAARHTPHPRLPEGGAAVAGGRYLADTGFEGRDWHAHWYDEYEAEVHCPPKAAQTSPARAWSRATRRAFAGLRQIVETVHARLLDTFGLGRLRPHSLAGLRASLAAKCAAYNVALWLNLQLGRPPLAFADLLDW